MQRRTLVLNTLCFALAFAAWVVFGPSTRWIARELSISAANAALLKVAPILLGSICRIPIGIVTDRVGPRLVFPLLLLLGAVAALAASLSHSFAPLLASALVLGSVGTTFIVGVQAVSSWTPREQQGSALGIFGAGNIGTALTTLCLPLLLEPLGWRTAFRVVGAMLVFVAIGYWLVAREAPRRAPQLTLGAQAAPLADGRAWRFGLYYTATFGAFVATTLTMTDIYMDGYHLSAKTAGLLATTFTFTASLARIPGGRLADRFGARAVVRASLFVVMLALAPTTLPIPLVLMIGLVFLAGIGMGIGMAGVIRYVPDYYPASVGAVSGIVGALGGLGGFLLPLLGQVSKNALRTPQSALLAIPLLAATALVVQTLAIRKRSEAATIPLHSLSGSWRPSGS